MLAILTLPTIFEVLAVLSIYRTLDSNILCTVDLAAKLGKLEKIVGLADDSGIDTKLSTGGLADFRESASWLTAALGHGGLFVVTVGFLSVPGFAQFASCHRSVAFKLVVLCGSEFAALAAKLFANFSRTWLVHEPLPDHHSTLKVLKGAQFFH